MKFYKPQLQLARTNSLNAEGAFETNYTLHAITLCRRTSFRAAGYELGEQVRDGVFPVTLHIRQDADMPDLEYITPVVHTIELGAIDADEEEVLVEVHVKVEVLEGSPAVLADVEHGMRSRSTTPASSSSTTQTSTTTKTGTKATVSSSDADDESRPGGQRIA